MHEDHLPERDDSTKNLHDATVGDTLLYYYFDNTFETLIMNFPPGGGLTRFQSPLFVCVGGWVLPHGIGCVPQNWGERHVS